MVMWMASLRFPFNVYISRGNMKCNGLSNDMTGRHSIGGHTGSTASDSRKYVPPATRHSIPLHPISQY